MATEITRDEFLERYGDVIVTFTKYHKWMFTYEAELPDGKTISVDIGGNPDDIYRDEIKSGESYPISGLWPTCGTVKDKAGNDCEWFFDVT